MWIPLSLWNGAAKSSINGVGEKSFGGAEMTRIMIIRHAEKHYNGSRDRNVSLEGHHGSHELTVQGWQRAGALAMFFAPAYGLPPGYPISLPGSIFAAAATPMSPSFRPQRTVEPLAARLGIRIDRNYAEGEEATAAAAMRQAPGPVLISWRHNAIPALARAICGEALACPDVWPEDRFDVVWILDQTDAGAWTFSQLAQRLFAHDSAEVI